MSDKREEQPKNNKSEKSCGEQSNKNKQKETKKLVVMCGAAFKRKMDNSDTFEQPKSKKLNFNCYDSKSSTVATDEEITLINAAQAGSNSQYGMKDKKHETVEEGFGGSSAFKRKMDSPDTFEQPKTKKTNFSHFDSKNSTVTADEYITLLKKSYDEEKYKNDKDEYRKSTQESTEQNSKPISSPSEETIKTTGNNAVEAGSNSQDWVKDKKHKTVEEAFQGSELEKTHNNEVIEPLLEERYLPKIASEEPVQQPRNSDYDEGLDQDREEEKEEEKSELEKTHKNGVIEIKTLMEERYLPKIPSEEPVQQPQKSNYDGLDQDREEEKSELEQTHTNEVIEPLKEERYLPKIPSEEPVQQPQKSEYYEGLDQDGEEEKEEEKSELGKTHKNEVIEPRMEERYLPKIPSEEPVQQHQRPDYDEGLDQDGEEETEEETCDFNVRREKKKREKRKHRKEKDEDIIDNEMMARLISQMKSTSHDDREASKNRQPATRKISMLPLVINHIKKSDLQFAFIKHNILRVFADWLAPMPDNSLPALTIRFEILQVLLEFSTIDQETLKQSGIGKAVMYLYKHPKEVRENKKIIGKLIDKWVRPFDLQIDSRILSRKKRGQRNIEQENCHQSGHGFVIRIPKVKEVKKGEEHLRPGNLGGTSRARVPQTSTTDYVNRPQSCADKNISTDKRKKRYEQMLRKFKKWNGSTQPPKTLSRDLNTFRLYGKHRCIHTWEIQPPMEEGDERKISEEDSVQAPQDS
ncbi:hypothetical protein QYM36_001098 [Artemia franciscana]|uniref:TFIIS N-terminal domain-containing protein n=1 Tax=Artemia franciscana TaxID=6661 RepID=A0AA88IC70_ARTSF|nr:hypothetical protein QYM36_001098 [Artemia franciscana]